MNKKVIKKISDSNLTIKELYERFNLEKISNGMGNSTSLNYWGSIRYFLKMNNISENESISIIDDNLIKMWIVNMRKTDLKLGSINHFITDVRVFLYWCMKHEYLYNFKIQLVKGNEETIKYFSDDELKILLTPPTKNSSFVECRTYAIICFILGTGSRVSTLCNIKMEDVDFERKEITYRHLKNKHISIVPMSNTLERVLKDFLNEWKRTDNTWLFCDVGEKQLTTSAVRQSLAKYCKKRGIKRRGPHSLRHNFSRGWIKNGGNVFTLQQMLTHSDLTMTRKYVRLFSDDLKKGFEQFSPLDNIKVSNSSRTQTIRRK